MAGLNIPPTANCKEDTITTKNGKHFNTKTLRDKVFIERKSLLLEMYDANDIRSARNHFVVFLLAVGAHQIVEGLSKEDKFSFHLDPIIRNFSDLHIAFIRWFVVFTGTMCVYPTLHLWAVVYNKINSSRAQKAWNSLWIIIVLAYYYNTFAQSGKFMFHQDLSPASSFTLASETARLLMKSHAFIRFNAEKLFKAGNAFRAASLHHYFEFLFMPTIIYRESYPRKTSRNWKNVLIYVLELIGTTLFINYLCNLHFLNDCAYFKTTTGYHREEILWLIVRNTFGSLIIMLNFFYFTQHSWQSMFAELTLFADGEFYKDWWNSATFAEYYRHWNGPVHDWIYAHIFKDIAEIVKPRSSLVPKLTAFVVSACVHGFVTTNTTKMFFPILEIMFLTFGTLLSSFKVPKHWAINVLFLYGYALGLSGVFTLQVTEYCVRQNPCAVKSGNYPFDWMYSKVLFNDCVLP